MSDSPFKPFPLFPLFMLHGWQRSLNDLKPLAALLTEVSAPHLLDLPGFGQAPPPPTSWSSIDYADHLAKHLDRCQIEQIDLLGHSFGGKVALSFAHRFPHRVRKIILISASGLQRELSYKEQIKKKALYLLRHAIKHIDKAFKSQLYQQWFIPKFASSDYRQAGPLRETFLKTIREDLSPCLPSIQAQTLLLWGTEDQETPIEMAHRFEQLLANATLIALPRRGHSPFQGLTIHLLAYYIRQFLREEALPDAAP